MRNNNDFLILKREMAFYKKMRIPNGVIEKECRNEDVMMRPISIFDVDESEGADGLFCIDLDDVRLVGYKIMMDYFDNRGKGRPAVDSRIKADMLLGIFDSIECKEGMVKVAYHAFEHSEKKYIFNKIKKTDLEITYPLVFILNTVEMPKWEDTWSVIAENEKRTEEERVEFLSNTEPHLRKATEEFLRTNDKDKFVIYDPACSTGEFLEYIKTKFPHAYTIGHDMDEEMVSIAKSRVDECECCNAFDSPIGAESIDILVLRFLNYSVVNRQEAEELFVQLSKTVKKDGYIICFGHTPVLLDNPFYEKNGYRVIKKSGFEEVTDSIFQYYILKHK